MASIASLLLEADLISAVLELSVTLFASIIWCGIVQCPLKLHLSNIVFKRALDIEENGRSGLSYPGKVSVDRFRIKAFCQSYFYEFSNAFPYPN